MDMSTEDKSTLKMGVWNHASQTDPSSTKDNTQGTHKSTSINGYWMFKKATELWGPIGIGWGYNILEEEFRDGVPLLDKESKEVICMSQMHTIKLRLWYPGCKKDQGPTNYGHTPYIANSQYGPRCDMEAPKKSLTDAIKKCLSILGFSADVFMGEFDDEEYVQQRTNEEAIEKADNKDEERERQKSEYLAWFTEHAKLMKTAQTQNELMAIFNIMCKKMTTRNDAKGIEMATATKDKRKAELEKKAKTPKTPKKTKPEKQNGRRKNTKV